MGVNEERQERDVEKQHKRIFFGAVFTELLSRWKREEKKTEKDFAKRVNVHPNMVTNWKKGLSYPQAANMVSICSELKVNDSVFNPITSHERDYVTNIGRKEQSRLLQMYADKNGLDEDFYAWLVKQKNFLRFFPFHSISTGSQLDIIGTDLYEEHPEEKPFPLLKYEFEDDFGCRKMMVQEDLDFIIEIQERAKKSVLAYCLYEKERVKEKKVAAKLDKVAAHYRGIDVDEVKQIYHRINFTEEALSLDNEDMVQSAVMQVAKKHGIRPTIKAEEIFPEFDADEVAQSYRMKGYSEEEITQKVEAERKDWNHVRQLGIASYMKQGYIIEGREDDDGHDPTKPT